MAGNPVGQDQQAGDVQDVGPPGQDDGHCWPATIPGMVKVLFSLPEAR